MTQHEALKELISAVQEGRKIGAYKACVAMGLGLADACELVRAVWQDARQRQSYQIGFYDGVCSVPDQEPSAPNPTIQHSER